MKTITPLITLLFVCVYTSMVSAQSHYFLQGLGGNASNTQIAQSSEGTTYLAVQYTDTLAFNITPDSVVYYPPIDSFNVCIVGLDDNGTMIHSIRFASTYQFRQKLLSNLIVNSSGQVILTGSYVEALVTEHQDTLIPDQVGVNAYVMSLDPDLQNPVAYSLGGLNNTDNIIDCRVTPDQQILLAGQINGYLQNDSVDVDLKEGVVRIGAHPSGGPLIAKYTEDLDLIWAGSLPQIKNNNVQGVVGDYLGNSYMLIRLQDTFDLHFGGDTVTLNSMDTYDLLLMKWDASGQLVDYKALNSASQDTYLGMEVDQDNHLHIFFKNRGKSIQVNGDTLLPGASLRLVWLTIDEAGEIIQQKEISYANQQGNGFVGINRQNEIIVADKFTGGDGLDFNEPGVLGDGFGRKVYMAWYTTDGQYLRSRTVLEDELNQFQEVTIGRSGQIIWIGELGASGQVDLYPGPQGSIVSEAGHLAMARSCVPIDENASLTITCSEGLHEVETSGTSFLIYEDQFLLAEGENALLELPDTIFAVISDEAGCPVYQELSVDSCQSTVSSTHIDLSPNINIFPNPVQDILFLEGANSFQSVRITNAWGQVVMQEKNNISGNALDLSALPSGMYILEIRHDQKSRQVTKFIKL